MIQINARVQHGHDDVCQVHRRARADSAHAGRYDVVSRRRRILAASVTRLSLSGGPARRPGAADRHLEIRLDEQHLLVAENVGGSFSLGQVDGKAVERGAINVCDVSTQPLGESAGDAARIRIRGDRDNVLLWDRIGTPVFRRHSHHRCRTYHQPEHTCHRLTLSLEKQPVPAQPEKPCWRTYRPESTQSLNLNSVGRHNLAKFPNLAEEWATESFGPRGAQAPEDSVVRLTPSRQSAPRRYVPARNAARSSTADRQPSQSVPPARDGKSYESSAKAHSSCV